MGKNNEKKNVTMSIDEKVDEAITELKEKTGISKSAIYEKGARHILTEYGVDIKKGRYSRIVRRFNEED